jgi:hypothetical protein
MKPIRLLFALSSFVGAGFGAVTESAPANTLTAAEKQAGWRLLFDGRSLTGWRAYAKTGTTKPIGPGWKAEDGLLKKLAGQKGGDLITEATFGDFEFSWEWRLGHAGANNGVKYFVTTDRPEAPGPEYQMLDDKDPKYAKLTTRFLTASLYEVLPPADDKPLRPAGEWNSSRIVVRGNTVEHWLNGRKVLTYEAGSEAVKAGVAASKFKKFADFGQKIRGHLMLTDHNDEAWFRNLKVRELPAK